MQRFADGRHWLRPAALFLILQCFAPAASQSQGGAAPWKTLTGKQPLVVARGGFSGLFPDSSSASYNFANVTSMKGVISWCDVQLTKDPFGICLPDLNMANSTNIAWPSSPFANASKTYSVNGRKVTGWFPIDFTLLQLQGNVQLIQENPSRSQAFDSLFSIYPVEEVGRKAQSLWLNVEHDLFYKEHKLSMVDYLSWLSSNITIAYISSPEIGFIKSMGAALKGARTKLIFRIPESETVEPTTNQTYDSLLKNLKFIGTFATGIVVPRNYIWPVTTDRVLLHYTSIVSDAHKANLEVFASGFANDLLTAYNYSYNPVNEYLSFVDNGDFSVDGLISDFPATASEAVACFSHLDPNTTGTGSPLIISNNGDSGDFPGCTDLAYKSAVDRGVDVIDCSLQITKDGNLICLSSIDLVNSTSVTKSSFATQFSTFPEIQSTPGIFAFNLTWDEIRTLKPVIFSPLSGEYHIKRTPANENAGNFMSLKDFLDFAKDKPIKGVLIRVENARFLVEKLGFDVVETLIAAVSNSGYDGQVMVMSSSSSTLIPFRQKTKYKIVYMLTKLVSDADPSALEFLKTFAHAVAVRKNAIFPATQGFVTNQTQIVQKFQSANLSVYAYPLMNEFLSIPWDFISDPFVEIQNLVEGASVDGLIMDSPATASLYRRKTCAKENYQIPLVPPHGLLDLVNRNLGIPEDLAPYPTLTRANVSELPLTAKRSPPPTGSTPGGQPLVLPPSLHCLAAIFLSFILLYI